MMHAKKNRAAGAVIDAEPAAKKPKVLQDHPSEPDEVVADQNIQYTSPS